MKIKILHKYIEINTGTDFTQLPIGTEITFKNKVRTIRGQRNKYFGVVLDNNTRLSHYGDSYGADKAKLTFKQVIKALLKGK